MRRVESFPIQVSEVENLWIPLADGTRLSARLWLPEGADANPVPAIVEYIPYRKRAGTRWRDEPIHRYFAGHGYAALRVDVRGTGESGGLLTDEYSDEELADGLEILAWIAGRPWCSGRIGLIGKSWGGINALQLAALRPPSLGAVITVCSSDDLWKTDAHYMGGCLLNENLIWGSSFVTLAALPPDPAIVGDGWRKIWLERLGAVPLYPARWMEHPRRDEYWRTRSVSEDPSRIVCPVLAVGGWADPYRDTVFRLLESIEAPCAGLVGPWTHVYPHDGEPGPAIGFLQEAVAWWDRWLGEGCRPDPPPPRLRAWIPAGAGSGGGRWVAEESWPSPRIEVRRFPLSELEGPSRAAGDSISFSSPQSVGSEAGAWCPFESADLPGDQRFDDARSLCFETPPLDESLEILGVPAVDLGLRSDRTRAMVAARLCDVAPDGTVVRVTYGVLDLGFRDNPERPRRLEAGVPFDVRLELGSIAWTFAPGHRIRLALSTAYWPIAWPTPEPVVLAVSPEASVLQLPVRGARSEEAPVRFPSAESAREPLHTEVGREDPTRGSRDLGNGLHETVVRSGFTADGSLALLRYEEIELATGAALECRFRIHDDDPLSAEAIVTHHRRIDRREWSVEVTLRSRLVATRDEFRLESRLEAREGDRRVAVRNWDRRVPRWENAPVSPVRADSEST